MHHINTSLRSVPSRDSPRLFCIHSAFVRGSGTCRSPANRCALALLMAMLGLAVSPDDRERKRERESFYYPQYSKT